MSKVSIRTPDIVIGRLPIYLRVLEHIASNGTRVTSSQEMGEHLGISPAQIRKDLSHFGEFGKQGTGYDVVYLRKQLQRILGLQQDWDVALIGAGAVGKAIMRYAGFRGRGFHIAAVFDNDDSKIGRKINNLKILHVNVLKRTIHQMGIRMAMITVPSEQAQKVADMLVEASVEAVLNYAPVNLIVPPEVHVQHIDPVVGLQHMTYYLSSYSTLTQG